MKVIKMFAVLLGLLFISQIVSAQVKDIDAVKEKAESGDAQAQTPNNAETQLKFSLYRNLKNLYIAIQNYISQLDDLSVSSFNYSMVIKTASKKLGELKDYMYEYMSQRF